MTIRECLAACTRGALAPAALVSLVALGCSRSPVTAGPTPADVGVDTAMIGAQGGVGAAPGRTVGDREGGRTVRGRGGDRHGGAPERDAGVGPDAAGAEATGAGGTGAGTVSVAAAPQRLPAVPEVRGPIQLRVVYPILNDVVSVRDSSFMLGSVGTGDARLTINGSPVRVWPNGSWLAWIHFPGDTLMKFDLVARTQRDSAQLTHTVRRPPRFVPPPASVWIDTTSIAPRGRIWIPREEYLPLSVRAVQGARVRIRLRGGTTIPLTDDAEPGHYIGLVRGLAIGPSPGPVIDAPPPAAADSVTRADTTGPVIEAILGADTARVRWPIQVAMLDSLPTLVKLDDDTLGVGGTDSLTVGRAAPGTTYHWFFPTGTEAVVGGRFNGDLRLRLSPGAEVWVPAADARPLTTGVPIARSRIGPVTLAPFSDRVALRVPVGRRLPFQVRESERALAVTMYGAVADVDWIRFGATDSLIGRVAWTQSAREEVTFTIDLRAPVWGYRARWDGGDLVLELRRPPLLSRREPLRGLRIMLDPGHPPFGATGPTGLREAEANLAVALRLREILRQDGAQVLLTRTTDTDIDLPTRVVLAERVGADLLISIHNNALPDGINPFTNNGTSVYYNLPRSLPLARDIQRELLRRLELTDLGVGWGDLAIVRGTWMPSVLCEGLFITIPDQEAALRSEAGQRLYALGVADGIRRFLRDRAEEQRRE